ncbi:hypothetical protein [Luteimonas sp. TWI1437]|uniref:hypothetical protein n=1 Tax=unclassified Luteimonas TaxID=2629088 RepID=UPI00320B04B8
MRLPLLLLSTALLAACSQPAPPPASATADARPSSDASAPAPSADAPAPVPEAAPAAAVESTGDARRRIGQVLGDAAPYETVFTALQKGVAAHDAKAVAALPIYPLRVKVAGQEREIADAAAFEREYDRIITADIARAVAAQTFDALFVNAQGVMLGNGQVWIGSVCADAACAHPQVGIVAIQD